MTNKQIHEYYKKRKTQRQYKQYICRCEYRIKQRIESFVIDCDNLMIMKQHDDTIFIDDEIVSMYEIACQYLSLFDK